MYSFKIALTILESLVNITVITVPKILRLPSPPLSKVTYRSLARPFFSWTSVSLYQALYGLNVLFNSLSAQSVDTSVLASSGRGPVQGIAEGRDHTAMFSKYSSRRSSLFLKIWFV